MIRLLFKWVALAEKKTKHCKWPILVWNTNDLLWYSSLINNITLEQWPNSLCLNNYNIHMWLVGGKKVWCFLTCQKSAQRWQNLSKPQRRRVRWSTALSSHLNTPNPTAVEQTVQDLKENKTMFKVRFLKVRYGLTHESLEWFTLFVTLLFLTEYRKNGDGASCHKGYYNNFMDFLIKLYLHKCLFSVKPIV